MCFERCIKEIIAAPIFPSKENDIKSRVRFIREILTTRGTEGERKRDKKGERNYGKETNEQIIILPRRKANRVAFNSNESCRIRHRKLKRSVAIGLENGREIDRARW